MTKYCTKCGTEIKDNASFCSECGTKLSEQPAGTQVLSEKKEYNVFSGNRHGLDQTLSELFLKKEGRLNRLRYFKRMLLVNGARGIVWLFLFFLVADEFGNMSTVENVVTTVIPLIFLIPEYCLTIRRLQDLDMDLSWAKWFVVTDALLSLVTCFDPSKAGEIKWLFLDLVYLGLWLYLTLKKGTDGSNRYGTDPLSKR